MTSIRELLLIAFDDEGIFTLQDAIDLGFKRGSVSSALSRGVKDDSFKRVNQGLYEVKNIYYEKLLGTQHYCNSQKLTNFLIFTIEKNDTNREEWLKEKIIEWTDATCSGPVKSKKRPWDKLGYQQRITSKREPKFKRFEVIET